MNNQSLDEARTLIAVVETGGIGLAAKSLGISQSTASRRIARLEARLGQLLIARTTRRVIPTELGMTYAKSVGESLRHFTDAEQTIASADDNPKGLVRISLPPATGRAAILAPLLKLTSRYPNLCFDIELTDRYVDLFTDEVDLAIRANNTDQAGIASTLLGKTSLVLVGSPGYFQRNGTPSGIENLKEHRFVLPTRKMMGESLHMLAGKLEFLSRVNCPIHINDFSAIRDLVNSGQGLSILPNLLVKSDLENKRLQAIELDLNLPNIELYALVRHAQRFSPKLVECTAAIQQSLSKAL